MTHTEFQAWLKRQQRASQRPKELALVNCGEPMPPPPREPGDESDFAPVANLADRLQASINNRRAVGPQGRG